MRESEARNLYADRESLSSFESTHPLEGAATLIAHALLRLRGANGDSDVASPHGRPNPAEPGGT